MPYTPPVAGSSNWDVSLNKALADINTDVVAAQATANDSLAGSGGVLVTEQDGTSLSYADLATVGPSVTVTLNEPRTVLVFVKAQVVNTTTADDVYMSFASSGATTTTPLDAYAMRHNGTGTAEAYASVHPVSCSAGTTTFTAKYRVDGGIGRFTNRVLAVVVT